MKNIRTYRADKYSTAEYEEVGPDIYKTYTVHQQSENSLSLKGVSDEDLAEELKKADGWEKCDGEIDEDFLFLIHEGKKYYKSIDEDEDDEVTIYEDMYDPNEPEEVYVTSIVFEPEPELGENKPDDEQISQYPLEDILDEFYCEVGDIYEKENAADKENSYVEFMSEDIEDIRRLLDIVGKHVYNEEDGGTVFLRIK